MLIGFYVGYIYTRYKLEPEFSYKHSEFPMQEIPFPAVTVCSPLFARDQTVNLQKFMKNPKNLTVEQQNLLAANVQACAPDLGSKIDQFCPLADTRKTIEALKARFLYTEDSFDKSVSSKGCMYHWFYTECAKIMNYVLTDFGFCFTFNLEGFATLFNTKIISDDFKCYSRDGKIRKNYYKLHKDYSKFITEANQSINWNLEKGFLTNSRHTLPIRTFFMKGFDFRGNINRTDLSNLCPKMGKGFLLFFHMPSEILTPFHQPKFLNARHQIFMNAKLTKFDESLRPYSPQKRNCYFEGERKLKFFKSYTKAHCQFECLANYTLAQCGCVKFSMPREKSTRICSLKETTCYIKVAKNWNLTCDCLNPCTYIEYSIEREIYAPWASSPDSNARVIFQKIFGEKFEVVGVYNIYQGFADFGGMLGVFFGASLISLIEIFYFLAWSFIKKLSKIKELNVEVEVSKFASSSTVHGVQFIFDKTRYKFVRFFWILAFIFAFSCCLYDSRESYWKLNVVPETESTTDLKPFEEIPWPAITIFSSLFTKVNYTENILYFNAKYKGGDILKLNYTRYHYFLANLYWSSYNLPNLYIDEYKKYVENITNDRRNHRTETDLFPFLFQSHPEVDEVLFDCKFRTKAYKCSELFKKVMNVKGVGYTFNLQNQRQIFNEEISKNFDSYGKFKKQQETQWSLDRGYFSNKQDIYPARASKYDTLELRMYVPKKFNMEPVYYLTLPNEIITLILSPNLLKFKTIKVIKMSAKSKRMDLNLRKFTPENRGCYFQDERKLQYFSSYTRSNCMLECFSNYTLKSCKCVVYLLPHTKSTKLCYSVNEAKCYYDSVLSFPPADDILNPCECLSTCNDIEYSLSDEQNPLNKTIAKNRYELLLKFQFDGDSKIVEEKVHVAFGFQNFLTNVGGFLGLYLGCSVISIFEAFYFAFAFLHEKLANKKNRIEVIQNNEKSLQNEKNQKDFRGTSVEILDLEDSFGNASAIFGQKVNQNLSSEGLDRSPTLFH